MKENIGRKLLNDVLNNLPELKEGKNIALNFSSGLDSTVLLFVLIKKYGKDRVKTLSFDFGQRHNIELKLGKKVVDKIGVDGKIIKLDYFPDLINGTSALLEDSNLKPRTSEDESGNPQPVTYVPFRNLQFASITAAFAESYNCSFIAQGIQASDELTYWDTTLEFTKAINDILKLNRLNLIQYISPFVELYKDEELLMAKELSNIFGFDILENTWSCYNGYLEEHNFKECGNKCTTCDDKLLHYIKANFTNEEIKNKFNVDDKYITEIRHNI